MNVVKSCMSQFAELEPEKADIKTFISQFSILTSSCCTNSLVLYIEQPERITVINSAIVSFIKPYNAKHSGLVKLAAFLSIFSKKVTTLPSPTAAYCYAVLPKFPPCLISGHCARFVWK